MEQSLPSQPGHAESFLTSVTWSWLAVASNLVLAFFVSPLIIRRLGSEAYGIWILVFSLIDYLIMFDLGLRSAMVTFVARARAENDFQSVNQTVNTAFLVFSSIGAAILLLTFFLAGRIVSLFSVSAHHHRDMALLLMMGGVGAAVSIVCLTFRGALDAYREFVVTSRILIAAMLLRAAGAVLVLLAGGGLIALGLVTLCSQVLANALSYSAFRRLCPEVHLSSRHASRPELRRMAGYGVYSLIASYAALVLIQGPPILVGYLLPAAFVGYYSLPFRLLSYAADAVSRVGIITAPTASHLAATRGPGVIAEQGIYINRYCFTLFLPFTLFLLVWGEPFLVRWVGAEFASHSAPLVPVFAVTAAFAMAGQFNSSSILFGMARHFGYTHSLVAEAVVMLASIVFVLPRFGILGAAWVSSVLMALNRGLLTPFLLSRGLDFPYLHYMSAIYLRPALLGSAVFAAAQLVRWRFGWGRDWTELLLAALGTTTAFMIPALYFCFEARHRTLFFRFAARMLSFGR